jgi:MoaA/NifB/PqqE/SkfB family radical SAM enzyme
VAVVELIKTKVPKLEVFDVEISDEEEAWFCEICTEVFAAILGGAFFPFPSWACGSCEYRGACRGA